MHSSLLTRVRNRTHIPTRRWATSHMVMSVSSCALHCCFFFFYLDTSEFRFPLVPLPLHWRSSQCNALGDYDNYNEPAHTYIHTYSHTFIQTHASGRQQQRQKKKLCFQKEKEEFPAFCTGLRVPLPSVMRTATTFALASTVVRSPIPSSLSRISGDKTKKRTSSLLRGVAKNFHVVVVAKYHAHFPLSPALA
jgi:hypothetical protein